MTTKRTRETSPEDEHHQEQHDVKDPHVLVDPYKVTLPDWISPEVNRRLRRFLDYTASAQLLYYVSQLPLDRCWGTGSCSRFLCDPATNTPLRMWFMGLVESASHSSTRTEPRSQFTLDVRCIRDVDLESVNQLLHLKHESSFFHAARSAVSCQGCCIFTAVFDATETYKSKHAMPTIPATDIVFQDLVLVEFFCYRERAKPARNSPRWTAWSTAFHIESVSLLARAPRAQYNEPVDTFSGHM
ncbi:uncharacterized protein TRAVEDRAFT_42927 [Trametes versicolor FP-101664 SS1]|uniref:uncharacterized protein n=1 Tax=Trametes versicolor (strain FP-101664) TaxID=717944 RepID=UPI0004621625|nr:uncharacterized protein TRAVEDRAFT_42927 [Trametes versicolor FP-101664 SS1]EIW62569.1 hypothetical protein TRAVEDRAFT_42927 [Trametes versicolor FP-101664 SS1]